MFRNRPLLRSAAVTAMLCGLVLMSCECSHRSKSFIPPRKAAPEDYSVDFSTFIGGSDWEHARDVCVDGQGNVYVVGGTASDDFPVTAGAYQTTQDKTGTQVGGFGYCDAFVIKFAPDGTRVWGTYLGGPNYDRAYGVEVDDQGYVYVSGRAGPGFPVTSQVFQTTFEGWDNGGYGWQNCFVAKIKPDGSDLEWASYAGVSTLGRDLAIDSSGNIYVTVGHPNKGNDPPAAWYANAFQSTLQGGMDCGVMKIRNDGTAVIWATLIGGSADESQEASIRVDSRGCAYVAMTTFSDDIPTTAGAHDRTYNGNADYYIAKLKADGSDLIFGTYLGGSQNDWISTHNLAIDKWGNAYVPVPTCSPDFPTTPGVYQETFAGGNTDFAIAKLSPTGRLLASTFVGGSANENCDGIYADAYGNVFVAGETDSTDFPVTTHAYQPASGGGGDAVMVVLSADFKKLAYSTYIGGASRDNVRSGCMGEDGKLYLTGATDGPGWPTLNAFQDTFAGGGGGYGNGDCILIKLTPVIP